MTTYYVRKGGSDASAGTSAGAAWATIGKALGASGIASGDTLYIGPGVYREIVTVAMTSATVTTSIIGDTDGSHTGDPAGPVIWTTATATDIALNAQSSPNLTLNGRDFLSFSNLIFVGAVFAQMVHGDTATSTDITFTDCAFVNYGTGVTSISHTTAANTASNWTLDRCLFWGNSRNASGGVFQVTATRHSADYNYNILVRNCRFDGGISQCIRVGSTGAGVGFGGGLTIRNCTFRNFGTGVFTADANLSTSTPITVNNCVFLCGTGLSANASGQITEDYNVLCCSTNRTNVTAGAHAVTGYLPLLHVGEETVWGGIPRPYLTPWSDSILAGFGDDGNAPSVDALNRARPAGVGRVVTSGTFTSGGTATATDSGASFGGSGQLNGMTVKLTGGTGSGQTMLIKSHTLTVLTVYGTWNTQPDSTSTYSIYAGAPAFYGKATAGAATTLTQSNATWDTNLWQGFTIETTAGTGSGQTNTVTSNTGTVLTVPTWGTNPDNTTVYKMYRKTSETAVLKSAGALERHDTASKETTLTDAGSVAWRIYGYGDQEVRIPVDASSTTITVKCSFDTDHGNTNKPQAVLNANAEIGVTTETKTCTGTAGSGTFETLTFSAFTPSAKGWVTVRLCSRSDKPTGRAVFDTLAVS